MGSVSSRTVFNSQDLPGEFLVTPFKSYRQFFAEKIQANSGLSKGALIIVHIVTGIFAYPIFGLLALIGMQVKPRGIQALREHNQTKIRDLNNQHTSFKDEKSYFSAGVNSFYNRNRVVFREFKVTKANAEAQYAESVRAIEECSRVLRKVYVNTAGAINVQNGTGAITIQLLTDAPVSTYWTEEVAPSISSMRPVAANREAGSPARDRLVDVKTPGPGSSASSESLVPSRENASEANARQAGVSPRSAQPQKGWLSRIGDSILEALKPTSIDPRRANTTMDRAMGEIRNVLKDLATYPNKTLIAVRIDGKGVDPFLGAMNLNLAEVPRNFAWHASLHDRMRDYLTKHSVTKFEICFCVITNGRKNSSGETLCDMIVLDREMTPTGWSSGTSTYGGMSFEGFKCMFENAHPVLRVIADQAEDVFAGNVAPRAWVPLQLT